MNNLNLFWLLLKPSLSSNVLTFLSTSSITILSGWLYVSRSQAFYEYFFGPNGISTTLLRAPDTTAALRMWLFGSPATYYIVLGVAAVITGLTVLTILQGIQHIVREGVFIWRELRTPSQSANSAISELFARLAVRVVASLAWGIYIALFATVLLPFVVILEESGIDTLASNIFIGGLYITAAFALLGVLVHMHVIFARLVALRPRLYGVNDIELAEL
jgi:hypothetical protein